MFESLNKARRPDRTQPLNTVSRMLIVVCVLTGCTPDPDSPQHIAADARSRGIRAQAGARTHAKATDVRIETSCEARFWRTTIVRNNAGLADTPALADRSFRDVRDRVEALNARGAHITVGGVLALLVFEGKAQFASYNDLCKENSYVPGPKCWETPKARYSYQYGLGGIHTSLFHPCKGGMRRRMSDLLRAHGFAPTAKDIASIAPAVRSICPKAVPDAVDYYIITAHDKFGIPWNSTGNRLAAVDRFPFFSPQISLDLFFAEVGSDPMRLSSDRAMLVVYGGKDRRYRKPAYQSKVLATYTKYRDAECP